MILVSAFNAIANHLGLSLLVKFVQILVMLSFTLVILARGRSSFSFKRITILPLLCLAYLIINAVVSIQSGDFGLVVISFLQISFFYICLLFFESQSISLLRRVIQFLKLFLFVSVFVGMFEMFVPAGMREQILRSFYGGDLPVAYISRDIGVGELSMRLGSFFLSPLTFTYSCVALLTILSVERERLNILVTFITVLSKVKTGWLGVFLMILKNRLPMVAGWFFLLLVGGILILPLFISGVDLLLIPSDTLLKSFSNHLVGLVSGVASAYDNVWFGEGLGRSGYVIFKQVVDGYAFSPFLGLSPYLNGNESTLGVISFQLGFIFLLLHISIFYFYLLSLKNSGLSGGMAFLFFLFVFQALSESSLTIFISLTSVIILVWLKKMASAGENENEYIH
ncbi:MAG: hypothetical protein RPS47_14445 [Colwellia sp.]|jgi:hypothetical protein